MNFKKNHFDFINQFAINLTVISESWKSNPEFFPKFQFFRVISQTVSLEKSSDFFLKFQFCREFHGPDRFLENSSKSRLENFEDIHFSAKREMAFEIVTVKILVKNG